MVIDSSLLPLGPHTTTNRVVYTCNHMAIAIAISTLDCGSGWQFINAHDASASACASKCMYVYIFAYICAHTCVCMCMRVHTSMYRYVFCVYICVHVNVYVRAHACVYMHVLCMRM